MDRPRQLRDLPACGLLTETQKNELGIAAKGSEFPSAAENASQCHWLDFDQGQYSIANLRVDTRWRGAGLDQLYRRKSEFTTFTPATVDGYPAVRTADDKKSCKLHVGVGDEQSFELDLLAIDLAKPVYASACEFAEAIARAMLRNIPDLR